MNNTNDEKIINMASILATILIIITIIVIGIQLTTMQNIEAARWIAEHPNETLVIWSVV